MAQRPMTNIEKVQHIMSYSRYGALASISTHNKSVNTNGVFRR
jgi:hypothetical protein